MRTAALVVALAAACAAGGCTRRTGAAAPPPAHAPALPELVERSAPPATADADHDAELTRRVRRAFGADPQLAPVAHRVTVVTIGGAVTLRGDIEDPEKRRRLGEAARNVDGVTQVDSQLR